MSDAHEQTDEQIAASSPAVACWRCDLEVEASRDVCPHCMAQLREADSHSANLNSRDATSTSMKTLMWSYAVLLLTVILLAFSFNISFENGESLTEEERASALMQLLAFGILDAIVVLVAMKIGLHGIEPSQDEKSKPLLSWLLFLPMLAGLLAINFGYHHVLREILQVSILEDEITAELGWLVFFIYCIQPAVIEELYCREFALRVLRSVLGRNSAVWITSIMFGLMHVGSPLSIPYLVLVGLYLGYARVFSGNLALPIALHFLHNLIVLIWK